MRILITGGAGCLGSNLIERFLPDGHEVYVIDNFATSRREVLPRIQGLKIQEGSIADDNLVQSAFDEFQPTHVIHGAAAYKDPNDWREDTATNCVGAINVARAAQKHQVKKLINLQTALVYGRPKETPIPVTHDTNPITSYGTSKLCGENYLNLVCNEISVSSLRLANITGPRLCIGPIPTFYTRLKEGKSCFCSDSVRDFLDIEDFFSVIDRLLEDEAPSGVFNISTGIGHSIKEVFDIVTDYLKINLDEPVPIVPVGDDDIAEVVLDPTRTSEILGWSSAVGFEDSIIKMLNWYDAHGVSDVYSHLAIPPAN